jgi:hypothetical protein
MPRITFRDYTMNSRPWWEYIGDAGKEIAGGVNEAHKERVHAGELEKEQALKERALAIEEQNAKARVLGQANIAAAREERDKALEAQKTAALQGLEKIAQQQRGDATEAAISDAVKSPEGALGPFGILGNKFFAKVAEGFGNVEETMGPKIEFAKQMTAAGATAYLTKETAQEKQRIHAQAYQHEADAVQGAVVDGVITPEQGRDFITPIQQSIHSMAKGGPPTVAPGATRERLAKAYDLHAKVMKRAAGWEESDKRAGELISTLKGMAIQATDPKVRQALLDKVSAAQGEWARTQHEDFRSKNDGEASVGGLEAVLFGAQAAAGELATPPSYQTQSGPNPALQMSPEAQIRAGQLQDAAAENRTVTNQPKYGRADNLGKKVNVGGVPRGTEKPAKAPQAPQAREKPAAQGEYRTIAPEGKAKATAQIEAFVADNGTPAISMDTDQPAEIRKLRMGLAKTLGLDPRDPFVRGALTSALLKLRAGQLGGKRTRAAGKASGPSLGETVSHLHPGAGGM